MNGKHIDLEIQGGMIRRFTDLVLDYTGTLSHQKPISHNSLTAALYVNEELLFSPNGSDADLTLPPTHT